MTLGPAPVLALLVGVFHVSIYVLIRGRAEQRVPVLVLAAFLGAWAGDALATRLGLDPLRIGDFHLIGASVVSWVGIAGVAIVSVLGQREPTHREPDARPISSTASRGSATTDRAESSGPGAASVPEDASEPPAGHGR